MICTSILNFCFFLSWSKKKCREKHEDCRSRHSYQPFSLCIWAQAHKPVRRVCACVCVNMQARGWCQLSFLYCFLPWLLFFWDKVSLNLMLMDSTRPPSSELKEHHLCSCTSLPPCLGSRIHCYACFFHVGSRYPNSGPHACAVVT